MQHSNWVYFAVLGLLSLPVAGEAAAAGASGYQALSEEVVPQGPVSQAPVSQAPVSQDPVSQEPVPEAQANVGFGGIDRIGRILAYLNTEPSPEKRRENCLREQLLVAPGNVTLQQMRLRCKLEGARAPGERQEKPVFATVPEVEPRLASEEPLVSDRARAVREAASNPFSLAAHQANYLLPLVYNPSPNKAGLEAGENQAETIDLDKIEVQFQLSVQVPVWRGFLGQASFMSLAYTNRSFWQAYNSDNSSPFRETNHEPELIMTWLNDWQIFGFQNVANQLAVNHQSNGRSRDLSRSWNRIYANFMFEKDCYFFNLKPWYRVREDEEVDDNPDLEFYLGHFEFTGGFRNRDHKVSLLLRNNLRDDNKGAAELRWSFPVGNRVRGYVKYFNGYGESLIDYDESVQTLGIGIELARGLGG